MQARTAKGFTMYTKEREDGTIELWCDTVGDGKQADLQFVGCFDEYWKAEQFYTEHCEE